MKLTTEEKISALTGLLVLVILFIIGWWIGKNMKNCKHKNKVYSPDSVSNFSNTTQKWICKDCGFEGEEIFQNLTSEYYIVKSKFNK